MPFEASVLTLQAQVNRLGQSQNSVFGRRSVQVSDAAALVATADNSAATGVYQLQVNSLAQAHQVASQAFSDADAEITQGTLTVQVGDAPAETITIDAGSNTLQGLADAINTSGAGVNATLVQDASGGSGSVRLLLSAEATGASNAISITNNLAADSGSAVQPTFDTANPVQAAANASITLGSGPGAITVESETNRVDGLIAGVTLDLTQADPVKPITLSVTQNTEDSVSAVRDFVDSFNGVMKFIDDLTRFNAETNDAGILLGNRNATAIQDEIRNAVLDVVPGVNTAANRLTAIGISVNDAGQLTLNETKLRDTLTGRTEGVSADDVRRLFALDAISTNSGVEFLLGSKKTQASSTPYEVDITQAATQASVTADNPLGATTVITVANDTLQVTIDGAVAELTLPPDTYTQQKLADQLEASLNAHPDLAGRSLSVGLQGGQLVITSDGYGNSSVVSIEGGTALADLGFTIGQSDSGTDVTGTFLVNGQPESANGRGRLLTGDTINEFTADLQLRVTLGPSQVVPGTDAQVTVTRGIAARLDQVLTDLTAEATGRLSFIDDGFDEQLASLQQSLDRQNALFEIQQQSLVEQFVALESAIGELQTTSSFLANQLQGLQGLRTSLG